MGIKAWFAQLTMVGVGDVHNKKIDNDRKTPKHRYDALVARYSRGSVALQRPGGYMTREEKDELKARVLEHDFT